MTTDVSQVEPVRKRRATADTGARVRNAAILSVGMVLLLSAIRVGTNTGNLTSSGTFGAALRLAVPIGLAALGALYAERAGIINIGIEGMMVLGTWFGAWAGYQWGPWWGIGAGIAAGAAGGLLHAVATVSFGVDHIISGVAINILAPPLARYLSVVTYVGTEGGGVTQSPRVDGSISQVSLPLLSGGFDGPDALGALEKKGWFLVSDVAGVLRGLTADVSLLVIVAVLLVPLTWWLLWRTAFGLRLRSVGEHPVAAESLGVNVYLYKYIAVVVSGGLAGIGGGFLALVAASGFNTGQTGGRGFIGLAAMIFGNWRPGGLLAGALTFGYTDSLRLRNADAVHALLLLLAIGLLAFAAWRAVHGTWRSGAGIGVVGALLLVWYVSTDTVPRDFTSMTPYVTTLLVLALGAQRLRMPAADGQQYRRGRVG